MVRLPASVAARYERFSLYNSPYPAHDRGCAVDLYPGENGGPAPSPVAGTVRDTRTVRCPSRPYAVEEDHLIVVETDDRLARILHVDPAVDAGDEVAVGDSLGRLVRSGFFGRWVDDHLHLGFRSLDANPYRASGSLPVEIDCEVAPLAWDGTGTIVETGASHIRLDAPVSTECDGFAALASDEGIPLDGGLAHYDGVGTFGHASDRLSLLGTTVATPTETGLAWDDVAVTVDGRRATGLSLFAARVPFGAKVVFHEGHDFSVGESVRVALDETDDPIRLG